jgi:rSAM/selenodomain-associated transferase 1
VSGDALVIMAKAPGAGRVKTRLSPHLGDRERVALYERLLEGAVFRLSDIPGVRTYITYTPVEEGEYFGRFGLPVFPQEGEGLGERMSRALEHVLGLGHRRAALVGADIPALGPDEVACALGLLDGADVVFGPASDGGYYLVAMKKPHPEIFRSVLWSDPRTLQMSLERARDAGLEVSLGSTLHDVDTVEDLRREGLL